MRFLSGNRIQVPESLWREEDARDFFFPVPGQTGKIILALMTENTPPLPEAFFGVNRKAGGRQVKIPISPFASGGGRRARSLLQTVVLGD